MKYFQGLLNNGPMITKMVIALSFRVRVGPTSNQIARGERANPEITPGSCLEARSTLKFGLKHDFLALKVKEHHSPLFIGKISERIGTPF